MKSNRYDKQVIEQEIADEIKKANQKDFIHTIVGSVVFGVMIYAVGVLL